MNVEFEFLENNTFCKILSYLSDKDICQLSQTKKSLKTIVDNNVIWKYKTKPTDTNSDLNFTTMPEYKKHYSLFVSTSRKQFTETYEKIKQLKQFENDFKPLESNKALKLFYSKFNKELKELNFCKNKFPSAHKLEHAYKKYIITLFNKLIERAQKLLLVDRYPFVFDFLCFYYEQANDRSFSFMNFTNDSDLIVDMLNKLIDERYRIDECNTMLDYFLDRTASQTVSLTDESDDVDQFEELPDFPNDDNALFQI